MARNPAQAGRSSPLLACGIAAGPLYVAVGVAQILTREGFDARRHALSLLSNGSLGWIQIGNFIATGVLVVLGAIGLRAAWRGSRGGTWVPLLLAAFGVSLIGAGIFVADPGAGFPPGTPDPPPFSPGYGPTRDGILHFVFGGIGFYAFIAATLVAARRFWSQERPNWALYSVATGVGFFASFMTMVWRPWPEFILTFYVAVFLMWVWHTALYLTISGRR
jgi:hypothetical protein